MFQIAIDVGGTFTDFVVQDNIGRRTQSWKVPSVPAAPLEGIAKGLGELAGIYDYSLERFLENTTKIIHGTTFGINSLLERRGASTALITTSGFRDELEMRRSQLQNQWNLFEPIPPVIVPRYLRFGLQERINYKGEILTPLDFVQLAEIGERLRRAGVSSVAVCLLFSFLNPKHELLVAEWLRNNLPDLFVSLSADIAPQIGHFERTSTTVINAFLGPALTDYLHQFRTFLSENGYTRPIYFIQNDGGLTDLHTVSICGVKALLSGPAGGARGGKALSDSLKIPHMVLADMGGTSFDVSLIRDGTNELVNGTDVAGYAIALPMLDIRSVGVGGGSIANIDGSNMLRVGPRSAGASPGPACYDSGGDEPTITDAALILGLLNPERFLAGRQRLSADKAGHAIECTIAAPLNLTLNDAAYAIYQVAAAMMADAVYLLTVRRGYDPRQFSLVLYGGAAPLFAGPIAAGLGVRSIMVPAHSSVFSARGMLDADLQTDIIQSVLRPLNQLQNDDLHRLIEGLKDRGREQLLSMGVHPEAQNFAIYCDIRYNDQHHEIAVPLIESQEDSVASLLASFHRLHEHLYGYSEPQRDAVVVNVRVAATELSRHSPESTRELSFSRTPVPSATRLARWEEGSGYVSTPIHDGDQLRPGDIVNGPAIIEKAFTTIVVPLRAQACLDESFNIIIRVSEA